MDAIRQISQTEQNAQQLVLDAQTKARSIIADAQRAADAQYEVVIKTAAAQANEAIAKAREAAAAAGAKQQLLAREDCTVLRQNSQKNMDRAVAIVVEKVVNG